MASLKGKGQITIVDLNDGKSMNMYLQPNLSYSQLHNIDGDGSYEPDWATTDGSKPHLIITPELYITGSGDTNLMQVTDKSIAGAPKEVKWFINGNELKGEILSTYGASIAGSGSAGYKLTLSKNMISAQYNIACECLFEDENDAQTVIKAYATFTTIETSGSLMTVVISPGDGGTVWSGNEEYLYLIARMYKGNNEDTTNNQIKWFHQKTGAWEEITADVAGTQICSADSFSGPFETGAANKKAIRIHRDFVTNVDCFKCEVTELEEGDQKGMTAFDIITVYDLTDRFTIDIESTSGNLLTKGTQTTTLKPVVWVDSELCTADNQITSSGLKFEWYIYDRNGNGSRFKFQKDGTTPIEGDGVDHLETTSINQSVTINKDNIQSKATIVCRLVF